MGWWSRGLAGREGFAWGMSLTEQHLLGERWGVLGRSSLVGSWDHPTAAALPRPCHEHPGTGGRSGRLSRGALGSGTACPSFPPSPAAPRCHGDRAGPRPRKCLFLLLRHFPPAVHALAGALRAGGHAGNRSSGPAPRPRPHCRHGCEGESGWVLSPWGPPPHVAWANHAVPPSSVPLLAPLAGAEARAGGTGGCTGALHAPAAAHSPASVLPVLAAGHSGSWPLTLRPPAPELPGTAQRGAGTSHLRVPEQQQEEEGGREGLRYGLREPREGGLGGLWHPGPQAGRRAELPAPLALPRREQGQPQPLWLQPSSAFQGSDADKSEDNLVVDEVSVPGAGVCVCCPSLRLSRGLTGGQHGEVAVGPPCCAHWPSLMAVTSPWIQAPSLALV